MTIYNLHLFTNKIDDYVFILNFEIHFDTFYFNFFFPDDKIRSNKINIKLR